MSIEQNHNKLYILGSSALGLVCAASSAFALLSNTEAYLVNDPSGNPIEAGAFTNLNIRLGDCIAGTGAAITIQRGRLPRLYSPNSALCHVQGNRSGWGGLRADLYFTDGQPSIYLQAGPDPHPND